MNMKRTFPLKTRPEMSESGQFGAVRKHDIHTGIDLHANEGSQVFAIEDGIVEKIDFFTGISAGSPWWEETKYIGILSESGYIVYGEVTPIVSKGQQVKQGELIGTVKKVLKKDKGKPTSMLHLELYSKYIGDPVVWKLGEPIPNLLLDPNSLIKD
jgi:murein DD-endopeptidase MepM/ murein hydrolase activator NlpD